MALGSGFNISVTAIAVRQDDEPCVGGAFRQFNGRSVYRLACFTADGTLKDEFNSLLGTGFNNSLRAITTRGRLCCPHSISGQ